MIKILRRIQEDQSLDDDNAAESLCTWVGPGYRY